MTNCDDETIVHPVHSLDMLIPVHPDIETDSFNIESPIVPKSIVVLNGIFYILFFLFYFYTLYSADPLLNSQSILGVSVGVLVGVLVGVSVLVGVGVGTIYVAVPPEKSQQWSQK